MSGLEETYYLNMGPQHPSMHGVLRLKLLLSGERIVDIDPIIGYAHRAHEKMAELRNYQQFLPQSARLDYLSAMIYNIGYCEAIEKIMGIEVPERAQIIRVMVSEFNRISSHLLWLGAFLLDLGGFTPFLYAWDDREQILDLLDQVAGSRLTYNYGRFGGVSRDVDELFLKKAESFLQRMKQSLPEYDKLVRQNVIFIHRCDGIGIIDRKTCIDYGITGPTLRAAGIAYDLRKDAPYGAYDRFDFEIPVDQRADALARYDIRIREIEQSLKIIEQALNMLPDGPILPKKRPKKFKIPAGQYYHAVESARGVFGMYIVADGTDRPFRLKLRTPSFSNLSSMVSVLRDTMIADTIAIVGSLDLVLPEIDR